MRGNLLIAAILLCIVSNAQLTVTISKDTSLPLKQSISTDMVVSATVTGGTATSYSWSKISGPGTPTIVSPTSQSTNITGFQEGTYVYRCTVNGTATDDVNITVRDWQKKNVTACRVGSPQVFTLSATSTNDFLHPWLRRDEGLDIRGGDTIKINVNPNNGGNYKYFYIGDFGGGPGCPVIVVPNGAPIKFQATSTRLQVAKQLQDIDTNFVRHAVFAGDFLRDKGGDYYGFQNVSDGWGFLGRFMSDVEIKGFWLEGNGIGMQIKAYSDSTKPYSVWGNFKIKNIRIHDNHMKGTSAEGFYIGTTDITGSNQGGNVGNDGPTVRGDSTFIYDNIVDSTGWDGIQTSALGYNEMHDNVVIRPSYKNAASQNQGMVMGGVSTGKMYRNILYKGTTATMQIYGYGPIEVYHNFVYSTNSNGIYLDMKNSSAMELNYPGLFPPLQANVHDNIIGFIGTNSTNRAIKHQNNEGTAIPGQIINNWYIDTTGKTAAQLFYGGGVGDTYTGNQVISSFSHRDSIQIQNLSTKTEGPKIRVKVKAAIDTFTTAAAALNFIFEEVTGTGLHTVYYRDADSDGYGDATDTLHRQTQPVGYVLNSTDCNDSDNTVYPGATEICDGKDNDCDGTTDEGVKTTYYQDSDGDGYGNIAVTTQACSQPVGYVSNSADCNDSNANIKPGASEICGNGIDDNCNGQVDENCGVRYRKRSRLGKLLRRVF